MIGRLHPLSFILYPFKPRRVRARQEELSPFDNSQNVKMSLRYLMTLPRFRNSENMETSALSPSVLRC